MEHSEIHKLLSAYCCNDLEPAQKARVEEHLASCPACRADLADLETALRLIRSTPEVDPPPWLTSRIMARLREESAPRRRWYEWNFFPLRTRLPLEFMALLVVCVSGYYLARNIENQVNVPTVQPEMPAPPPSTPEPGKPAPQEPAPAVPSPRAPRPEKREQPAITQTQPQPAPPDVPKAAEQQAPPPSPAVSGKATAPPAYAPAPLLDRERRGAPAAGAGIEAMKAEPQAEQYDQALGAAPDMKRSTKKAKKAGVPSEQSLKYEEAPAASRARLEHALPTLKVHLVISDISSANEAVRQAVTRSGGTILEADKPSTASQIKLRIGKDKLPELLERLERIGRIAERPSLTDAAGMVELEIIW